MNLNKYNMYSKRSFCRREEITSKSDNGFEEDHRDPVRRDYTRVLHSPSFRRLAFKTQLFPSDEIDFFRNRLTHSLEVAQLAKDIALRLNYNHSKEFFINPEICEIAGLVHDLGHPPFGHNGEKALDDCMKEFGGFEGNAQTIRILTRLEKRELRNDPVTQKPVSLSNSYVFCDDGEDLRLGLNLSARVLASALKYDKEISESRDKKSEIQKGYYASNAADIKFIKDSILENCEPSIKVFKTVECQIMDIADDIAYSTSDLEDAFKAGFLTPYDVIAAGTDTIEHITEKINQIFKERNKIFEPKDILTRLKGLFQEVLKEVLKDQSLPEYESDNEHFSNIVDNFIAMYNTSKNYAENGYLRTRFTSYLINKFIDKIEIEINESCPCLSKVSLPEDIELEVNILKHFTFERIINSSKLKVAEARGYTIVEALFDRISNNEGYKLLPEDLQTLYKSNKTESGKKRIICDFIAGMTDRYALEFYCRLFSEEPQSIFKPL